MTETQQQGKNAALLDVTYHDNSDYMHQKDQRALELDLIRKDGVGFKLELSFPSAADQAAEGQDMFNQARKNLTINGL
ncbi:hypothetical protein ACGF07_07980 [Kitasatospora sp. NPDC048194]|uniref:hypothetical protein n=1 Tax=Kitasatospora sp. NPDC048194 TaxID=3364045 RepID=UPI003713AC10